MRHVLCRFAREIIYFYALFALGLDRKRCFVTFLLSFLLYVFNPLDCLLVWILLFAHFFEFEWPWHVSQVDAWFMRIRLRISWRWSDWNSRRWDIETLCLRLLGFFLFQVTTGIHFEVTYIYHSHYRAVANSILLGFPP